MRSPLLAEEQKRGVREDAYTQAASVCECTSSENEKFRPRISFASLFASLAEKKNPFNSALCAASRTVPSPKRLLFSFFDYMHIYLFYITFDNVYQTD